MAVITATNAQGTGRVTVTETTLGASDSFVYTAASNPVLTLRNPTAGSLTVTIDGGGATTVPVRGVGSVDVSGGYSTGAIAAGAAVTILLSTIERYLPGTIAVTGGTGIVATLVNY